MNFLVLEDDEKFADFLSKSLSIYGKVFIAKDFESAKKLLSTHEFECAILDIKIGNEIIGPKIAKLSKKRGVAHVIAVTNFENDEDLIRQSYESGVDDFLKKSNLRTHLEFFIKKLVNGRELRKNVQRITKTTYITKDADLIDSLESICNTYAPMEPIFISGESGVGKTQLAKCLKYLLGMSGELIELNCAGLDDEIIKSELFGHEKGSFTGANQQKIGKVELASDGILFLDEVGDLPLSTQETLLKVIEEKEFTRVGGVKKIYSNFLLVTATLKNLEELVISGKMRADFFNRINGRMIHIKPLRERKADLKILIDHFLGQAIRSVFMDSDAKEILLNYSWPGNIRELSKVIFSLSDVKSGIVTKDVVAKYFFDKNLFGNSQAQGRAVTGVVSSGFLTEEQIAYVKENQSLSKLQERIKNEFFAFALQEHQNNKNLISKNYRISRRSLFYYLKDVKNKRAPK
ncbi:MAG: sigma 54-interacting transcriptional regulator [Bacteriovoracaceae bacterium]|nr:sigma 54-interacting transcriptional regulator [Bacteriovoracaceae bacterium]